MKVGRYSTDRKKRLALDGKTGRLKERLLYARTEARTKKRWSEKRQKRG